VPFTLKIHAGKYRTQDKLSINTDIFTRTKHNSEKSKQCKNNSKTKLSRFSRLLRHLVRKWGRLILQLTSPQRAREW